MGLAERFWRWLTSAAGGSRKKEQEDLYPLDVDELVKELRLLEDAKRLGEAGKPAPDAKNLSGPEAGAVQRIEEARQSYVGWGMRRLGVLNKDFSKRDVTQAVNRARLADKEFEQKASRMLAEREGMLRNLGETARRLNAELAAFRTKHGLAREPDYPTSSRSFFLGGVLLVLVVLEGLLNAGLFAQGMRNGLVEGFGAAAVLAALNVLVAFLFGKFVIRYCFHRAWAARLLGFAGGAAAVVAVVVIGLGIAHFRDSLTSDAADPASIALQTLRAGPFSLHDGFSWALFFVSVLFGIGSLADGLATDDRYPGYGAVARRARGATEEHEEVVAEVHADLEELKDEELKSLDRTLQDSQAVVAALNSIIDDKKAAAAKLSNALGLADASLKALLGKFRAENGLHRGEVALPKYFNAEPELRQLQMPDFAIDADRTSLKHRQELVQALVEEAQRIRASVLTSFSQQFDRLKPLGAHFPNRDDA